MKLAPGFAKAHTELGMVLYMKGDTDKAAEHLRIAVKAGDPEAADLLKKIGK